MDERPDGQHGRDPGDSDDCVFELSAGHLALDFANTVSGRLASAPVDHLTDYGRLVSWSVLAGVLTPAQGQRLRARSSSNAKAAGVVLRQAITVREAIFTMFSSIAAGKAVPGSALADLNEVLPDALSRLRVEPQGKGYSWRWSLGDEDLGAMLAPVVRAGADLLTSVQVDRVRECRADTCAWLFLDRSKNGTRCWCDMSVCGNRAKARRHYAREKAASRRVRSRPRR